MVPRLGGGTASTTRGTTGGGIACFPLRYATLPTLRSLMVAGGGWGKKGIRGAGSVVRYAYSFGRHSRQPFGDRPRYAAGVTSPLRRVAPWGSYCACYAVASQACPPQPHWGCLGCPLRVCSRRLKHGTDALFMHLCHRVFAMSPVSQGDGKQIIDPD